MIFMPHVGKVWIIVNKDGYNYAKGYVDNGTSTGVTIFL